MAYRDLLLGLAAYPDVTPDAAVANGVALARRLGGEVTALALAARIKVPKNALANALVGLDTLARDEEARSISAARSVAALFLERAGEAGVTAHAIVERAPPYDEAERLCAHARTRDMTLLPVGPAVLGDVALAEAALFQSGRPVTIFPEDAGLAPADGFATAAVAWDGSRAAARSVADALPALARAKSVRVLAVVGEKPSVSRGGAEDLLRHLAAHGLDAEVDEISAAGEPIGRILRDYVSGRGVELLVMGGFGHSRAREFVLGGATASVIEAPPCPVLMSH